ncbi:MAG: AMP-binding protein [Alphaproteobacteria bacterium]|nr:AMP-binding protein [Alphaproteobacteria bacterium]
MTSLDRRQITQTFPVWFNALVREQGPQDLFFEKIGESWQGTSLNAVHDLVQARANALVSAGLKKGNIVALIAPNSLNWDITHHACLMVGAVVLGADHHAPNDYQNAILEDSHADFIITDNIQRLENLTFSQKILTFEDLKNAAATPAISFEVCEQDPAILTYTSGTTGKPKGIIYTQQQLILALDALHDHYTEAQDIPPEERTMACWLPLSNLFQRMLNLFALDHGFQIYYCPDPLKFMDLLPEIRPAVLVGVPRLFEKIADTALRRMKFFPQFMKTFALRHLIGPAIKKKLGGRIRILASGSAKMPSHVLDVFEMAGLTLYELYGMSENIIPLAGNNRSCHRKGSVGKAMKYNEIIVQDNGEIAVRSPGLGRRYSKNQTLNGFKKDAFLKTNDFGRMDQDGFLYVEGRIDNVIKTSTGLRILCDDLEEKLLAIPDVEQALVVGSERKLLTAILVSHANDRKIAQALNEYNRNLPSRYQICGALVSDIVFSPMNGLATPNLKLKRNQINEYFSQKIDDLYSDIESHIRKNKHISSPIIRKVS